MDWHKWGDLTTWEIILLQGDKASLMEPFHWKMLELMGTNGWTVKHSPHMEDTGANCCSQSSLCAQALQCNSQVAKFCFQNFFILLKINFHFGEIWLNTTRKESGRPNLMAIPFPILKAFLSSGPTFHWHNFCRNSWFVSPVVTVRLAPFNPCMGTAAY